MMKLKRQSKILELIKAYDIDTQEELAQRLSEAGFSVTQATVSRDIHELKLSKILNKNGKHCYAVMFGNNEYIMDRLLKIFRESTLSMDYAQNILVIKTLNGMAEAVGAALDAMDNAEIVGTICGDNTLICVVRSEEKAVKLMGKLKVMTNFEQ